MRAGAQRQRSGCHQPRHRADRTARRGPLDRPDPPRRLTHCWEFMKDFTGRLFSRCPGGKPGPILRPHDPSSVIEAWPLLERQGRVEGWIPAFAGKATSDLRLCGPFPTSSQALGLTKRPAVADMLLVDCGRLRYLIGIDVARAR